MIWDITKSSVDGGGRGAVDGRDGESVLGSIGKDFADVVASDDAGGDNIEKTHDGNEVCVCVGRGVGEIKVVCGVRKGKRRKEKKERNRRKGWARPK